jgi:tetratricopeptide (TPR) repeat protein
MTFARSQTPGPPDNPPSVRLDSWKEIAAYLGKVERTVKRWESERALPIHRPPGGRGSVYAYTWELDQWLQSARDREAVEADVATRSEDQETRPDEPVPPVSPSRSESLPGSPNAPVPAPAATVPAWKGFVWSWRIPVFVLLPVCLVLAADFLVHRRTPSARASSILNPAIAAPAPSIVSSDREKRLAHELYLEGRFEWNKRTADSLSRALDLFTQAIVHDPFSARNYAGLSETYLLMHEYSLMPDVESTKRAIAAARKAVELDDSLAEAHRSLAFAEVWGDWDFQAGEREFRRAIKLDPNDPLAHLWFAIAFNAPGWRSVSLREFDRAQELDPTSPVILANKSMSLFVSGEKEAGVELARQVERTNPDFVAPHRYLAQMDWTLHDYSDFLIESRKMAELEQDPVLTETIAASRAGYLRDGERGLVHDLYATQERLHGEGKLAGGPLERTCIRLGKKEEALRLLEDDYAHHRAEFLWLLTDTDLQTLRDEPRFQALLNKLHFPAPAPTEADPAILDSNPAEQVAAKHN